MFENIRMTQVDKDGFEWIRENNGLPVVTYPQFKSSNEFRNFIFNQGYSWERISHAYFLIGNNTQEILKLTPENRQPFLKRIFLYTAAAFTNNKFLYEPDRQLLIFVRNNFDEIRGDVIDSAFTDYFGDYGIQALNEVNLTLNNVGNPSTKFYLDNSPVSIDIYEFQMKIIFNFTEISFSVSKFSVIELLCDILNRAYLLPANN